MLRSLRLGARALGPARLNSTPRLVPKLHINRSSKCQHYRLSSTATASETDYHTIIKDGEKVKGPSDTMEFQAETRMLLDIVARSLYSEKEVFVRELISNASDALEKVRYVMLSDIADKASYQDLDRALEIHISTDKQTRILTIQDTGIGMTREELIANIGTIAKSGSKAFLEQLKEKSPDNSSVSSIIGQFGVGFYSVFMVADKVELYTRSTKAGSPGLKWSSDGSGTYEIQEADGVQIGSKIVIHLKTECREYSDSTVIQDIIKRYSNFVGSPIFLESQRINSIQPLWLMDPKQVTPEEHTEFYRFVGNSYDMPRFTLHYKTDAPLTIRAVLYFPESKPGLFDMSRDTDGGVALYTRKVLIKSKAENILPKWLRFVKGVVDSEDIPLNLSRELLQDSALIRKLRTVLTNRILRFLHDQSTKNTESFDVFYRDYGMFLKEGIVTSENQLEKEEISKLLRFESSLMEEGKKISLPEYCSRIKEGQRDIYYLAAPNRTLAESSPYYETLKKQQKEVLFCYEPYDEIVLMQLRHFNSHDLVSVEKQMRQDTSTDETLSDINSLTQSDSNELTDWIKKCLPGKVFGVKTTNKLENHPCVVTVEEMAAARHFIRTQSHQFPEQNRYTILQPQLEINPKHPIIKKLSKLMKSDTELATLLTEQLFNNALVAAGLVDDPRGMLVNMNQLLTRALEKH